MTKWNKLLAALDQVFGFQERSKSSMKKMTSGIRCERDLRLTKAGLAHARQSPRSACSSSIVGGPLVWGSPTATPAQPMSVTNGPNLAVCRLDISPPTPNSRL
jgi:hypothetical protein